MSATITTNGAELRVEDSGGVSHTGPALMFLHYWGGSADTWRKVVALLPDVRCIAVNQRGWGGSTVSDGRYDLDTMANDVAALIVALALEQVILVGHSMGGKVAQIVAKRKVEQVRALVLVAPGPPTPMPVPNEVRQAMLKSYRSPAGVDDALVNLAGPKITDDERESVRRDTLAGDPGAKREWTERGMIADLGIEAGDISIPVTLLVGSVDKVENPVHEREVFKEAIPQTLFVEIPGVGHLSPLEAPQVIATACRNMIDELMAS